MLAIFLMKTWVIKLVTPTSVTNIAVTSMQHEIVSTLRSLNTRTRFRQILLNTCGPDLNRHHRKMYDHEHDSRSSRNIPYHSEIQFSKSSMFLTHLTKAIKFVMPINFFDDFKWKIARWAITIRSICGNIPRSYNQHLARSCRAHFCYNGSLKGTLHAVACIINLQL